MQDRLGVPLAQLVPAGLGADLDPVSPERWIQIKQRSGEKLMKLIAELKQ